MRPEGPTGTAMPLLLLLFIIIILPYFVSDNKPDVIDLTDKSIDL